MPTKTPLALVKEKFGDKAKLVEAVQQLTGEALWVSRTNKDKGLAHVSNAKLLRLHATFTEVKDKFGTREKLIEAILELRKRTKDVGLRQTLSAWPVPRLFDEYKSTAKRLAVARPESKPKRAARVAAPKAVKPAVTSAKKTAKSRKTAKK
jgi:hypothetical protein